MTSRYDLVIVGMGSGGMTAAEFASTLGLQVAVVERARPGGDCLWTGCVPSKALLASARAAHTMRHADRFGLGAVEPLIDTATVWARIRDVQRSIAESDDDPERFRDLGVEVVHGSASVTGPHEVTVDGVRRLEARVVLLCTGSRPAVPPLPGLAEAGYLSSEDVFELDRAPRSVVVIGAGPVGVEMAQAFARLGIRTTLLQRHPTILPRDEPSLAAALAEQLVAEGVELHVEVETTAVTAEGSTKTVHGTAGGQERSWSAEEIFVATGRRPNAEGLGLEALGVAVGPRGVAVDDRGRTAVRSVYAVGDLVGRHLFTHAAGYEAVRAVRDAFFPGRGAVTDLIPWCTFTDPELAHAGMTTAEAEVRYGDAVDVWRLELAHSDRARAEGATEGAIVVVTARGRVVGAHVLAPAAGEMIHELALAMRHGLSLTDVASLVHVYPTLSTGIGQLAAEAAYEKARRLRWLVRRGR